MTLTGHIYYAEMDTIIGTITLARTKKGLCRIDFSTGETILRNLERWSRQHFLTDSLRQDDAALMEFTEQVDAYFTGSLTQFKGELDLIGTPFQKVVWNKLMDIPYGEVRSYKEIAQAIGAPKAVRAVGGSNNKNNIPIIIPCHRVIGSNGALVGYGGGLQIKETLLDLEGSPFVKRKKA